MNVTSSVLTFDPSCVVTTDLAAEVRTIHANYVFCKQTSAQVLIQFYDRSRHLFTVDNKVKTIKKAQEKIELKIQKPLASYMFKEKLRIDSMRTVNVDVTRMLTG